VHGDELHLVRNPHFVSWSASARPAGHPDAITIVSHIRDPVGAVRLGHADVIAGTASPAELAGLRTAYASRLHSVVVPATEYYFLNTRVAPFDRIDARRALNYAVDRRGAIAAELGAGFAEPTCQLLPPSFPGYRSYCPYAAGPDISRGRRLVRRSGTQGMRVAVWAIRPQFVPGGRVVVSALRAIGYRASLRAVDPREYFANVQVAASRVHIGMQKWLADFPAASAVLSPLIACPATTDPAENWNWSRYCDRETQRRIADARRRQAADPSSADGLWAQVDRRVVDLAVVLPLFNPRAIDFVSARVGGYRRHPQWGVLFDQLWVR
jgi:peptide/nickel transport system substrate-binding protein